MFKVNNKNTRTMSMTSIVDFEQVNVSWEVFFLPYFLKS